MPVLNEDLATLLRTHRASAGLTQEELAEDAGVSARTISDIERGLRSAVYRDTARRLAEALGLSGNERVEFEILARGRRRTQRGEAASLAPEDTDARILGGTGGTPNGGPGRAAAGRIPVPVTRLIGRERELILVVAALKDPERRLITLTGPGGIGKSRLAIEAAALTRPEFHDGVYFVSLAAERDAARVPAAIVRALGITRAPEPILDALVERLADRGTLLVLDTFEPVLDAAPMIGHLLARCAGLKVLATSRESLRLRGEHEFPVPTLAVPASDRVSPDGLSWYPGTVLFVERAKAVKPDLAMDPETATLIAQVTRRLEGLPLAIELAAARMRHLPLPVLRDHLEHRLEVLTGGPRDLPLRQQTMRGTVGWSYDLLEESERSIFRHLAVFTGGATLDAARVVCAPEAPPENVLPHINALVDKSLVFLREARSPEGRYDLLDVIRDVAWERLVEHGESNEAVRRHAAHFLALSEQAELELGKAGHHAWFQQLDEEHDNLRAALRRAIADRNADLALRIAGALWQFWRSHGDYAEGREWLRTALAIEPTATPAVRAKALWGAAGLAYHHGDRADTAWRSAELLQLARETGDPVHLRNALTIRGVVAMNDGRFAEAVEPFREALALIRPLGPSWLLGTSHLNLGSALLLSADVAGARLEFEQALRTYRGLGDDTFSARATLQLGYVALETGDRRAAEKLFRAALEILDKAGDRWGLAEAFEGFSALVAAHGDPLRAAHLFGAAESLREVFGARTLPADRATIERYLRPARESIGQRAWRDAAATGHRMPLEDAVALARQPIARRRRRDQGCQPGIVLRHDPH
jgi:predicted ATPase/transcriptional regulator with XRE-family HTH domain